MSSKKSYSRGVIAISKVSGTKIDVSAIVFRHLAVHKGVYGEGWSITHIGTGYQAGWARTRKLAMAAAAAIEVGLMGVDTTTDGKQACMMLNVYRPMMSMLRDNKIVDEQAVRDMSLKLVNGGVS